MDDSERPAKALARKSRLNFPVVLGDAELGKQYGGIFGLPVTFLIDRTGKIRFHTEGEANLGLMENRLKSLLSEPNPR
jgi:peroxiredoxin